MAAITARSDVLHYVPFPLATPVASIRYIPARFGDGYVHTALGQHQRGQPAVHRRPLRILSAAASCPAGLRSIGQRRLDVGRGRLDAQQCGSKHAGQQRK
ncbi:hypothetical protein KQH52_11005 [Mycetohabitans sp. B7]|nr:hypothetical protein [Mycetohabitans sp. B3]MCG1040058.1 hypothetical protein [Mycetohabitans sp. B7]